MIEYIGDEGPLPRIIKSGGGGMGVYTEMGIYSDATVLVTYILESVRETQGFPMTDSCVRDRSVERKATCTQNSRTVGGILTCAAPASIPGLHGLAWERG